ncbi:MAG: hypothetical protein WA093_04630 [Minisyncoccales bacterium]
MISQKALDEFKEIYFAEYGEQINDQTALELGLNLLTMFKAIYRQIPKKWLDDPSPQLREEEAAVINK